MVDIASRLRQSIEGVHRTAQLSGMYDEEELKRLNARHAELMALLDAWSRYVPPDPNKRSAALPPEEQKPVK